MCSLKNRVFDKYFISPNSHRIMLTEQKQGTEPYISERLQFGCERGVYERNVQRKNTKMFKGIIYEIMSDIIYFSLLWVTFQIFFKKIY